MPVLYIITGFNGAGKSSIAPDYLPISIKDNCNVFDGDKLFMQKKRELWESGSRAIKENRKIAEKYLDELFHSLVDNAIQSKKDFVYEGHFTNNETWKIPERFKKEGYTIHMIFFGLKSIAASIKRVAKRTE